MNPMLIAALAGAGLGGLSYFDKKRQAENNRELQATIAAQGRWTKMQPSLEGIQDPSLLGEVAQGAAGGFSFGAQNKDNLAGLMPSAEPDPQGSGGGGARLLMSEDSPGQSGWMSLAAGPQAPLAPGQVLVNQPQQSGAVLPAPFASRKSSAWPYMA